ncbi:hypothetical protein ACWGIU_17620 [Streptomyces sp. NPDC054840]
MAELTGGAPHLGLETVALSATVALALSGKAQPAWAQTLSGVLGYTIFMTCWPVIAGSVAALVRSRIAAVLLLVLWPVLGEHIAGFPLRFVPGLDTLAGWLPFGAGRAAMAASADTLLEADRALVQTFIGSELSAGAGTTVFIGFTASGASVRRIGR